MLEIYHLGAECYYSLDKSILSYWQAFNFMVIAIVIISSINLRRPPSPQCMSYRGNSANHRAQFPGYVSNFIYHDKLPLERFELSTVDLLIKGSCPGGEFGPLDSMDCCNPHEPSGAAPLRRFPHHNLHARVSLRNPFPVRFDASLQGLLEPSYCRNESLSW